MFTLIIPYTQKGIEFFEKVANKSRALIGPMLNNHVTLTIRHIDADELFYTD